MPTQGFNSSPNATSGMPSCSSRVIPELLAPAGSPAALHAAVRAGADAVYLGLESFNARRGAENFTLDSLRESCDYAHARGVNVYITLNTVVLPQEVPEALEMARQAWRSGADAFIVQDIGIASELSRTLPQARLHISTQMNTHNTAGIVAAHELGAVRVTLARELSLAEIAHLAAAAHELGMEVECFAHGAICVCYSGQCLMSSLIGGRSANRGLCAQACRLPYELHNRALRKNLFAPGEHLLSPMDLCSIDVLPQLVATGVASLKIEGRMKSPEYVFSATSAYRQALDEIARAQATAADSPVALRTEDFRTQLEDVFSRGFSTAYLEGKRGNDIMSYQRPNNRGTCVGRIDFATEDFAALSPTREIIAGDVLEIWTGKGRSTHIITENDLRETFGGSGETRAAGRKNPTPRSRTVQIRLDRSKRDDRAVRAGDRVFRVRSAATAFDDDVREPRIPVRGTAVVKIGQPAMVSFEAANPAGAVFAMAEGNTVEVARTKAITHDEVHEHINRLGQTPFVLESLDISLDDNAGLGFSQLHRLRSEALDSLMEQLLAPYANRTLPRAEKPEILAPALQGGCHVAAWVTNPACARAAKRAGAELIYVPALHYKRGEAVIAGQLNAAAEQAGYPKGCIIALPVVDHDPIQAQEAQGGNTREFDAGMDVWEYVKSHKPVLVENVGAALRAQAAGALVEFGPHIPIANRLARDEAARLGAERIWLSPELTCAQIESLAKDSPVPLGITIIGAQELMVTEHCLLMSQGPCAQDCANCPRRKSPHYLKDRKDFEFPVITDALGRSHLFNSVQLDVAHSLPELLSAGITAVMVDATLMNTEETAAAVARAVRARNLALRDGNTVSRAADTTTGHLFRGIK